MDDKELIKECLMDRYDTLKDARETEWRAVELRQEAAALDKQAQKLRDRVREFTIAKMSEKFEQPMSTVQHLADKVRDNHMSAPEKEGRKKEIYSALMAGGKTQAQIARDYGVTPQYVSQIKREI